MTKKIYIPHNYVLRKLTDGRLNCVEFLGSSRESDVREILAELEERDIVKKSNDGSCYALRDSSMLSDLRDYIWNEHVYNNITYLI
jgi:hypothetical protein